MSRRTKVKTSAISLTLAARDVDTEVRFTAADLICTLPRSNHASRGNRIRVINGALSGGVGIQVAPNGTDTIRGAGLTGVAGKNLINDGGTDVVGDSADLVCNGLGGWDVVNLQGTWSKTP